MLKRRILFVSLLICGCFPAVAQSAEKVTLRTGFTPNKLGEPTTISFGFSITATGGQVPSPLTNVNLHLPAGINPATATLGDAQCETATLLLQGLEGCPPNARVGFGKALAEVVIGPDPIRESAQITVLNGPPENQRLVLLFYAEGITPVAAQLVFPAVIFLEPEGPFSGHIDAKVPPIASVPGAPDVSVLDFQSTLGPRGVTYYRNVRGKTVAFHPEGIAVPTSCPRGGFRFSADYTFMDGSVVTAKSAVPCPARTRRHGSRGN